MTEGAGAAPGGGGCVAGTGRGALAAVGGIQLVVYLGHCNFTFPLFNELWFSRQGDLTGLLSDIIACTVL